MRLIHRVIPGLVAGILVIGTTSGVLAAKSTAPGSVIVAAGQVSGLASSSPTGFTLTWTPKKAGATPKIWQIELTTTTKETAASGTTGGLQNGDYAVVVGTQSTTGVSARLIRFSSKPFSARAIAILRLRLRLAALSAAMPHNVRGTVNFAQTTSSAISVTVTTKGGTKTVSFAITGTTKFRVGKTLVTTMPVFTDGEKVIVRYKVDLATKALDALVIGVAAG
jgi:hypothetical protein